MSFVKSLKHWWSSLPRYPQDAKPINFHVRPLPGHPYNGCLRCDTEYQPTDATPSVLVIQADNGTLGRFERQYFEYTFGSPLPDHINTKRGPGKHTRRNRRKRANAKLRAKLAGMLQAADEYEEIMKIQDAAP